MKNIDIFYNRFTILKRIDNKLYIRFIIYLIIFFISCIVLITMEYPNVYKIEGFLNEDKIVVSILKKDMEKLKGDVLKIDNKTYKYKILAYDYLDNYKDEIIVTLLINETLKDNKVVSVLIENGNTNLYKSFIKKLWKGF